MPSAETVRVFTVTGDPGSIFTITVVDKNNNFYNFSEDTSVALAFSSNAAKLKQKTIGSTGFYSGIISFPAVSADNYYIITLYADSASGTSLNENISSNEIYILPRIHKYNDTTVTFSLSSASSSGSYNSMPSDVTFIRPSYLVQKSFKQTKTISFPVTLSSSQFVIARQPKITDFEFTTTKTTYSDNSGTSIELTDISGLSVNMGVTGSGIASNSVIREIIPGYLDANKSYDNINVYNIPKAIETDVNSKQFISNSTGGTIVISNSSTWGVGETLTFTGKGSVHSNAFNNTSFSIKNLNLTIDPVVTTADAAMGANSNTIPLTSTDGIKAADTVIMSGIGVKGTPHVDSISAGASVDVSVEQEALAIDNGQTLTFTGSSRSATITGDVTVLQHGTDNITLTLALDNILTVG